LKEAPKFKHTTSKTAKLELRAYNGKNVGVDVFPGNTIKPSPNASSQKPYEVAQVLIGIVEKHDLGVEYHTYEYAYWDSQEDRARGVKRLRIPVTCMNQLFALADAKFSSIE
jgi:hypothetical protein